MFRTALVLAAACASLAGGSATAAADQSADGSSANPAVFHPRSRPYGSDMATWAEHATQWVYGAPLQQSPLFDPTGANCAVDQEGPVWYVARIAGPPVFDGERRCTIPRHKSILLYIGAVTAIHPCAADPGYGPGPGQSLYDFLAADAKRWMDTVDHLSVSLDGTPINGVLEDYRFVSDDLFSIRGDLSLQDVLDGCITGSPQNAVVDGFFMMFKPLSRGAHNIVVHGTNTLGHDKTFRYYLTIE